MKKLSLALLAIIPVLGSAQPKNYLEYHHEIIKAEEFIVDRRFKESVGVFRDVMGNYDHVFLRDIKVAAQLCALINDSDNLFYFLEKGMKKGWTLKNINKNRYFKKFRADERYKILKENQDLYKDEFYQSINLKLRDEMKKMLIADQKRALRVALTPIKRWREKYTNQRFVPNNRKQVRRINDIIDQTGYPGEKLIGAKSWATVIISHNEHDTIYHELRPKLYKALETGHLAASDLAIIETWRTVVDTNRQDKGFIIWSEEVTPKEAAHADSLRQTIGLRSIHLNNRLVEMEKELKMKLYLSSFHGGTITVKG